MQEEQTRGLSPGFSPSTSRLRDESTVEIDILEVDDVGSDMGTGGLRSSSGNKFRLDEIEECLDASGVVKIS